MEAASEETGGSAVGQRVRRAATGDQEAWSALVEEFDGLVWRVARSHRLGEADAADVVQSTWLLAVEHVGRLEAPERFGAWLVTTARREALRTIRRGSRVELCEPPALDLPDTGAPDPDDAVLLAERTAAVRQALTSLPPRGRALLGMLGAEPSPSYAAIAAELDMPIGSIGPTRARSLARLRRHPALALAA